MTRKLLLAFPLILLCFSALSYAQLWTGVIDPSRAVDWSQVGVVGGIPARTTICATLSAGATVAQINSAISACPSGQTVFLNAGTYNLSGGGIHFYSVNNVTLRGAGANQTFLVFTGGGDGCNGQNANICVMSSDVSYWGGPSNTANWTAGYAKGTTVITLSSAANLKVGTPVVLDQTDDTSDPGTIYECQSSSCTEEGTGGASRPSRGETQEVIVTACTPACPNSGSTSVTISSPIYMPNWTSSKAPGAWWASNPVTGVGIEDLSVDDTGGSALSNVQFSNATNSWVMGIRSLNAARSHVWLWTSAHITVRDSYFYGTQNAASESYGFEDFLAGDSLIENNIYQKISSPRAINGDCEGCVIGYNFSINQAYAPSANWQQPSEQIHSITNMDLYESNMGEGIYADNFHGTHNFETFYRNRYDGDEANNGTTVTANTSQILYPYSRYFNMIGNVLGTSGYHTNYQYAAPADSGSADLSVYQIGTGKDTGDATPDDAVTVNTLMRWGNYDVVNAAVRFVATEVPTGLSQFANPLPAAQTIPPSLYYSSTPSWWPSSKPWPAVGPDVTGGNVAGVGGHAYTIPAADCYLTTMAGPANGTGNVLSFNAATCYPSSGAATPPANGAPAPPTNLVATPH